MTRSRPTLTAGVAAVGALALLALLPHVLGRKLSPAFAALANGDRTWLALGFVGFAVAFVCGVGAWRAAFAAAGARLCPRQAAARIGVGALVNSVAPARLGDAVKVALLSRVSDAPGRLWLGGGVYAALAVARTLALASVFVAASATGALPLWPAFGLCGVACALVAAGAASQRFRSHPRVAQTLAGMTALVRDPRRAASVVAWSYGVQLTRLAATIAVARGLHVPDPALAALVIVPALDAASALPLTPGSFGIGSGAVAVALASRGIGITRALGVGLAIQTLETMVSIVAGSSGALYLAWADARVRRWAIRGAVLGASTALALAVGALWFDLF